ncbi:hypothetical protein B9Z45_16090 [Limnohabitans sp. 2KL-17]|uniref:hypothetical protein n=1 Tax=Limnohabitans sp. 2KL-17 TaxID=1100704 RepID=UPI000D3AD4AC|nr:hypothetical protein [Limnohabitans sp. 2KL-17]PUE48517.1 hypothetical protein B9Z45_16090 [Limnohabitans sp. 2KL-17]
MKITEINATVDELMTLIPIPSNAGTSAAAANVSQRPLAQSAGWVREAGSTERASPYDNTLAAGAAMLGIPLEQLREQLKENPAKVGDGVTAAALAGQPSAQGFAATAIEIQNSLPPSEQRLADQAEGTLRQIVYGADAHGRNAAAAAAPPELRALAQAMANDINNVEEQASLSGGAPLSESARQLQGMQT